MTNDDDFLGTKRARIIFMAVVLTGLVVAIGVAGGVAAFTVLGLLAVSVPGLLAGVEPLAAAWWIAVALFALEFAQVVFWTLLAGRRGLGEWINTGHAGHATRPVPVRMANAAPGKVGRVLVRVVAAGYVLAREMHGPAAAVVLVTLATAGGLVAADALMLRWSRYRNRRYWKLRERRRRQDRSAGDGQAVQQ